VNGAFDLVVSEITELGKRVGVAGWCRECGRMLRPIPSIEDTRWPLDLVGSEGLAVGNVVRFRALGGLARRPHPYTREDVIVAADPMLVDAVSGLELVEVLRASEAPSVAAVFGPDLRDGTYVDVGTERPSLAAVRTWAGHTLSFDEWEHDGQPRLRCVFTDGEGVRHSLSVVSRSLLDLYRGDGLDGLTDLARRHRRAHIRLGLELPDDRGRAYLRVNDILFH
jgi:hypothetical protein